MLDLNELTKEQLVELVKIQAKNTIACDGCWFQALERERGMDEAIHFDEETWKRFPRSEARRAKKFLGLDEHSGLDGLERALPLRAASISNEYEITREADALVFRITNCRVQEARASKGMPYHPCKSVGAFEHEAFASAIDERISVECLSCFPEVTDDTCNCSWRFEIRE